MIRGGARITAEREGNSAPPRCPACGCTTHSLARTWEVRCATCRRLRYPLRVDPPPEGWECRRCAMTPPEERQRRQEAAARAMLARAMGVEPEPELALALDEEEDD